MIPKILNKIRDNHSFLITTHESPDGDAVGSTTALGCFLRALGKDVVIYFADQVPETYRFLPMADTVVHAIPDKSFDVCFVLDAGEMKRAGKALSECTGIRSFVNIDHHPYGEPFGEINFVDPKACATGVLIYRIIHAAGHVLDHDTALCMYTAIVTDTGSFRYSNANQEAFHVAGELVALGINSWSVAEKLYESQPQARLELLAEALATLTVAAKGNFASITVTLAMYEKTGANAELTDGFVNYPRSIHGVEVAVMFREVSSDLYKVSFRSKGSVNVSKLAMAFGGGGHHNAAGCTVCGSLDEVRRTVFHYLEQAAF
jgi:bifunctional oligoribonuclease and PAP phosphatase NrnA